MISVFHGDNIRSSREAFISHVASFQAYEKREIDGKSLDETLLTQALESQSLFESDVIVVIERMLANLQKKKKLAETVSSLLISHAKTREIVLWEEKEIGKTLLDSLGSHKVINVYKVPSVLFQFLDSLQPHQAGESLRLLDTVLKTEAIELVYYLMVKRIRQLFVISIGGKIDTVSPWQLNRLTGQVRRFTMNQLESMYKGVLEDEYQLKSGNTPFGLRELVEERIVKLAVS